MAKYTDEQLQQLKARWKGHEDQLKDLAALIKEDAGWADTPQHRSLMEAMGPLPEGVYEVETDLRGSYLRGVSLAGANLHKADLCGAVLERADLSKALLMGACLSQAFLEKADLSGAALEHADLTGAILEKAYLSGAVLEKADLSKAFLAGGYLSKAFLAEANLTRANLWGAALPGANLWSARLRGANLWGADLSGANLEGADFSGANLENADLSEAKLRKANLSGAYLQNANLSGADLRGAVLHGTDLTATNLSNTKSWVDVKWNSRDKLRLGRRGLAASERKTLFDGNDVGNANWAGAAMLKRYVEDENLINEYIRADLPWWRGVVRWLWKWTCDYGRSFKRWVLVSFSLVLAFGYVLVLMPNHIAFNPAEARYDWLTPFYYSLSAFTTLGFGDAVPLTRWGMLVISLQVLVGYIMLGGLISLFVNKLSRRA